MIASAPPSTSNLAQYAPAIPLDRSSRRSPSSGMAISGFTDSGRSPATTSGSHDRNAGKASLAKLSSTSISIGARTAMLTQSAPLA